jgi:hypothetical protein
MCPLHSDDFLTGIPSRFLCSSLLCYPNIRRVFQRLCRLLNVSNGVLRARDVCSFEGIFRSKLFRIALFGLAAPPRYSRQDFGPSNCFFRASSAFKIFEAGFRSLELSFWASSASKIFEAELRSLKLFLSGQQRLQAIRGWASILRVAFFGPVMPSKNSSSSCGPLNHPFRACSMTMLFKNKHPNLQSASLDC